SNASSSPACIRASKAASYRSGPDRESGAMSSIAGYPSKGITRGQEPHERPGNLGLHPRSANARLGGQYTAARFALRRRTNPRQAGWANVASYHTPPFPPPHGACTMTPPTTKLGTAADAILALDLGKYKSVACIYRSADDKQFTTIATSRAHLTQLFSRHQPAVVLIEACLL